MPVESTIRKILGDTTELDEQLNDIQEEEIAEVHDEDEEDDQEEVNGKNGKKGKKKKKNGNGDDGAEDEDEFEIDEDLEELEEADDPATSDAKKRGGESKKIKSGHSDPSGGQDDDEDDLGGPDVDDKTFNAQQKKSNVGGKASDEADDAKPTNKKASDKAEKVKKGTLVQGSSKVAAPSASGPQTTVIGSGTKVKMEQAIISTLGKLSRKELAEKFNDINNILSDDIEDIDERESINTNVDFSEDINALLTGEEQEFSEEFTEKALTIFETAVNSKVKNHVEKIEEKYQIDLQEAIIDVRDELAEQLDKYLDYVISEWMKDNELAVEQGLKHEVSESFITGLKDLFESHQIDVPDDKVDLVEQLQTEKDATEEELDKQLKENIELRGEVAEYKKAQIIEQVSEELTDSQKEKMATLCEGVDFTDEDTFIKKAQIIAENYFSGGEDNDETLVDANEDVEVEESNETVLNEHVDISAAASMMAKPALR